MTEESSEVAAESPAESAAARSGLRLVWWPMLVPLALVVTWTLLLQADGGHWLRWIGVLLLLGAAVLPLSLRVFRAVPEVAFAFAPGLGLLLVAFVSWSVAHMRLVPMGAGMLWAIVALVALPLWGRRSSRAAVAEALDRPGVWPMGAAQLSVLVFIGGLWSWVRGLVPRLEGLEKFMDVGFMNSMWRGEYLPAADMWLAGSSINYYYFGQYTYTSLAKLTGIAPAISYNLAMATTFALFAAGVAGLVGLLLGLLRARRRWRIAGSLLAVVAAGFSGNGHSFLYAGPGKPLLGMLQSLGIDVGKTDGFFFPDSTRFIGLNPLVKNDQTIAEFPYYSFLVSDLHAHVINTVTVLLLIAVLAAWLHRIVTDPLPKVVAGDKAERLRAFAQHRLYRPEFVLVAMLLAISGMANYWDLAIYYVLTVMVLAAAELLAAHAEAPGWTMAAGLLVVLATLLAFVAINHPLLLLVALIGVGVVALVLLGRLDAPWLRVGATQAWVLAAATLLSMPFNLSFEPISKSLRLVVIRTPLWQWAVLWGPVVTVVVVGLAWLLLTQCPLPKSRRGKVADSTADESGVAAGGSRASWLRSCAADLPMPDVFAVIMVVAGLGLLVAPEVIYVKDIYEATHPRANTMFKFTYQGFILLTVAAGYLLTRLLQGAFRASRGTKRLGRPWVARGAVLVALLGLGVNLWYPFVATGHWISDPSNYVGLNGTAWQRTEGTSSTIVDEETVQYSAAEDAEIIDWFNENVAGQPVVLEAASLSYTHLGRISAYTGLPTVIGWQTHEWLWRTSRETPEAYATVVAPRQQEVADIYTAQDAAAARELLAKYDVEYVVIGQLERLRYPELNQELLVSLGEVAFQAGDSVLIKLA